MKKATHLRNIAFRLFLTLFCAFSTPVLALVTTMESFYNPETDTWLLLANDQHLDLKEGVVTKNQQKALLDGLKRTNGLLLVEDRGTFPTDPTILGLTATSPLWKDNNDQLRNYFTDYEKFNVKKPKQIKIVNATAPVEPADYDHLPFHDGYQHLTMLGLAQTCIDQNIPCKNVECRFFDTYALPHLTAGSLIKANDALVERIQSWTPEEPFLCQSYNQIIEAYYDTPFVKLLHEADQDLTIRDLLTTDDRNQQYQLHNNVLVDATLLNELHAANNKKVIVSLCGSNHHTRIRGEIEALGFQQQKSYGQTALENQELAQCILPVLDITQVFNDIQPESNQRSWISYLMPWTTASWLGLPLLNLI
jgi:hypothetical protein